MRLFCSKCQKVFEAEKPEGASRVKCPVCGGEQDYPQTVPGPGVVVGDFLIEKLISRGGMGEVFLAKQISLDRPVALKVLQQKHIEDREYVESLFKEARAAAKLSHPNIVQAYAVGEENGIFYFAMEYIRGETFKQILKKEKTIEFTRAATVIRDIARAIGAAWREQKLVHQDIKPDNIMLDANGFAKLSDLGLAKVATGVPDENDDDDKVLGTPQYISPEQLTGVPTDIRSDIYSLGATFFHFVTGRFPYVAKTGDEIARMHIECPLQPPKEVNPALPEELNRIIVKMMEKDINKRYQTSEELIADLDAFLRNPPSPAAKKSAAPAAAKSAAKPAPASRKPAIPKLVIPGKNTPKPQKTEGEPASEPAAGAVPPGSSAPETEPAPATEPKAAADPSVEAAGADDEPRFKRPLKIALISAVSAVLLAVILLAALVICFKYNVLPQGALKTFAGKVSGWFGVVTAKRKPAAVVSDAGVEYERAAKMPFASDAQRADFIARAEALLAKGEPADVKARAAYIALREKFAAVDEKTRFSPFRSKKKKERDEIFEERRRQREAAEAERRREREAEAERRRAREAEAERRREREAEAARRKQQAAVRNYNELKREIDRAAKMLVDGFYAAANGDDRDFEDAAARADEVYIREGENSRERKLVGDYRDFRKGLPGELKKLRDFRRVMGNIQSDVSIMCTIPGEGTCRVVALNPDGSADVVKNGVSLHIPAPTLVRSGNFKKSFVANLKDRNPNALFYYGLMIRKLDSEARKNAPAGFWKKHLDLFVRASGR